MERLLVVDGHNLLFQMFFGMPARIVNWEGKAIQGTLGFVGALIKIIKMTEPSQLLVLFDGEHENARTELLPGYKANRIDYSVVSEEENPFSQLSDVYRALDYMGIRHTEAAESEADDVAASYALRYGGEREVVIASYDSDFFQLISERVSVLRYRGKQSVLCDTAYIRERFGVTPSQYADFKALTGDPSDNIKGAWKVGPKTAALLLRQFGSLEEALLHPSDITKPSVREALLRDAERLRMNCRLIKLDGSAKLPFSIGQLAYRYNGITTSEVLMGIHLRD